VRVCVRAFVRACVGVLLHAFCFSFITFYLQEQVIP